MSTTDPPPPWRRALVIGLGRSGLAAVQLLRAMGVDVRGYDARPQVPGLPDELLVDLGSPAPPATAYDGIDLLVLSPGVPPQAIVAQAQRLAPKAAIHGEMGLALSLVGTRQAWPRVPTVLITGTNGKSTVTALTGALLEAAGHQPFIGGNLGIPLCERLHETLVGSTAWCDALVLECSSYQLETLPRVPTDVAMLINLSPDHLDRYDSLEHYARTKARVFTGLGEPDLALLDADDPWTERLAPANGHVRRVGDHQVAYLRGDGDDEALVVGDRVIARAALPLAGRHNARNALFALLAAQHLGVSEADCRQGLSAFEGLPHRMVLVRQLAGVAYYNDSKATNVASAIAGLSGLDRPFVLIAGGLSKGDDLGPLRQVLAQRGRGLIAVGSSAEQFAAMAAGVVPVDRAEGMHEAVTRARAMAADGEAVVLAPACASFDQYRSYAQRGEAFIAAVQRLH
ncbi:MAG: UDP-N-acetylmuramoyl-L-alanine--D-glutamate ligase [Deltaproteobacteria bacterium]|nr:UDP-N-acetylmuramoyl-L-alanine--D-glutamate ligase [Deltaproteobacteria bacterium]